MGILTVSPTATLLKLPTSHVSHTAHSTDVISMSKLLIADGTRLVREGSKDYDSSYHCIILI